MTRDDVLQNIRTHLSLSAIEERKNILSTAVTVTPLQLNERLSSQLEAHIYCKREDQQQVRSYKIRGAYNTILKLKELNPQAQVVAASAGNHAQGVAFACRTLEIPGRIYIPQTTPLQKQERILYHGKKWITLIKEGMNYDEAAEAAAKDAQATGATWVHAFDDISTIQGQATIGYEIYEQCRDAGIVPEVVVVPVGGAGCLAGIASCILQRFPQARIVGVEPENADSMRQAILHNGPVVVENIDPFVDGTAVKKIGNYPWKILTQYQLHNLSYNSQTNKFALPAPGTVGIITVPTGALCSHILDLYQNDGIIVEPAGALATTGMSFLELDPNMTVVGLISGGNNDVMRYGEIMERSLVYEGLKHYFLVDFAQKPGSLRAFLDQILGPYDDITLFEYVKRNNRETGAALVGIQLTRTADLQPLLAKLEQFPLRIEILRPGTAAYEYLT